MNISEEQLLRIIREELGADSKKLSGEEQNSGDTDSELEVEPKEDVWSGGDNLELPVDQSEASGGEENVKEPEMTSIVEVRKKLKAFLKKSYAAAPGEKIRNPISHLNEAIAGLERSQKLNQSPQPTDIFALYEFVEMLKQVK